MLCIASTALTYRLNCGTASPTISVSWSKVSPPNKYFLYWSLKLAKKVTKLFLFMSFHVGLLCTILSIKLVFSFSFTLVGSRIFCAFVLRFVLGFAFATGGANNGVNKPPLALFELAENRISVLASVWKNTLYVPIPLLARMLYTVCINLDHKELLLGSNLLRAGLYCIFFSVV